MDLRKVLDDLRGEAVRLLEHNRTHDEIIILKTAAGNVYYQLIRCAGVVRQDGLPREAASYEEEIGEFLAMLIDKEDTCVKYILAVANGKVAKLLSESQYSVEMPPYCIRRGLAELNPQNADAIILTDAMHNMTIADSMPPPKAE